MEMNLNFIVGFIVNQIVQSLRPTPHSHIDSSLESVVDYVNVPAEWIGTGKKLPQFMRDCNQIVDDVKCVFSNILLGYYLLLEWETDPNDKMFTRFKYYIKKKEKPVKKMTVEEVEQALGYKIEIVSKENK